DTHLTHASQLLTLDHFPDPSLLVIYQNQIHSAVVHQLDHLLLSPTTPLSKSEFNEANRAVITHILKAAWVIDEGEFEYYLSEFDHLLRKRQEEEEKEAQMAIYYYENAKQTETPSELEQDSIDH
ncbi:MAG: hypothetical protein ACXWM7_00260, partial [Parachlamydiaceae bacterium]